MEGRRSRLIMHKNRMRAIEGKQLWINRKKKKEERGDVRNNGQMHTGNGSKIINMNSIRKKRQDSSETRWRVHERRKKRKYEPIEICRSEMEVSR